MDITVAVTRLSIFVFVYALVLGIPFLIGYRYGHWHYSTWIMLVLATAGPYIYSYLRRQAENRILEDQKRYQKTLLQTAKGMGLIKETDRLVALLVRIIQKTMGLDHAAMYLLNGSVNPARYTRRGVSGDLPDGTPEDIAEDDFLVKRLRRAELSLLREEFYQAPEAAARHVHDWPAEVFVPIIHGEVLVGLILLGRKENESLYSDQDMTVLNILASQAALAVENCWYLEAETKRMEEEGLKERMESLDHMASSMAHEIDNPMHGVRTSLAFIKDFIVKDPRLTMPEALSEDMDDAIRRIENCAKRVSSMIKAILDYSRLGTGQLMPVKINDAVDGFMELIRPELKKEKVDFALDVEDKLPLVFGDRIQIEEILMNFVRNAVHAVKFKEEKKVALKIFKKDDETVRIECADNGYGIKPEIINDIFLSSMTTKGSTEGTGLGLYRVRKIVNLFKGRVWAESAGAEHGATFIVELPALDGNMEQMLKKNMDVEF